VSNEPTISWRKVVFFFYDDLHEDEAAEPDEIILFFYPDEVPRDSKLFLQGGCSAMINFASKFTSNPVDVVTLKRTKIAFKQLGKITMVLTSSNIGEEDDTLCYQLEVLYRAFRFYNGSFPDVFELFKDLTRKELIAQFKEVGRLLIPLLQSLQKNLMRAFDPMPYTELPAQKGSRFFLEASQILNEVKSQWGNIAGCLFYDKSVLCTHLDLETTRWVLNLVILTKSNPRRRDALVSKRVAVIDDAERSSHHPFLLHSTLEVLRKNRDTSGANGMSQGPSAAAMRDGKRPATQQRSLRLPEYLTRANGEGEYVGLYILCLKNISIGVIMDLYALHDPRHLSAIKGLFGQLLALEQNFVRASKECPPPRKLSHNVSIKNLANTTEGTKQYNYLVYESLTGMAKGTAPTTKKEVERSFLHTTAKAHNMFKRDPALSQVILRDNNGCVYGRKTFGREVYYQQFHNLKTHYDFVFRLEKDVRNAIQEELNISVL